MKNYDMHIFNVPEIICIDKFFTMFIMEAEGGDYSSGEAHDFWECTYVISGKARTCINGRVYMVNQGDLILYKPMEFHQFFVDDDKTATFFTFSFSLKSKEDYFLRDNVYRLDDNQTEIIKKMIDIVRSKTQFYPYSEKEIEEQIKTNINFSFIKTLFALEANENDMATMLKFIYRLFLDIDEENRAISESDSPHSRLFKTAVSYMNNNLGLNLSISDVAKHCCVSESSLKSVFLEFSQLGVHKYFFKLKINKAATLLKKGMTARAIAYELGFHSQEYFSTAFKRETGLSPRAYRSRK